MSRAKKLLEGLGQPKKIEEPISEGIKRIPVKKVADLGKVLKMAQDLPKSFDAQWNKMKSEKQALADLVWSMNHSFREIRLWLEDNFTLDPKNMEGLSPEAQALVNDTLSKVDHMDTELNGLGSAIYDPSRPMGSGAIKRHFKGLEKEHAETIQMIKDFQAMAKKEKLK